MCVYACVFKNHRLLNKPKHCQQVTWYTVYCSVEACSKYAEFNTKLQQRLRILPTCSQCSCYINKYRKHHQEICTQNMMKRVSYSHIQFLGDDPFTLDNDSRVFWVPPRQHLRFHSIDTFIWEDFFADNSYPSLPLFSSLRSILLNLHFISLVSSSGFWLYFPLCFFISV